MKNFWTQVLERLEREPVFFALVVANSAHSPGTLGARLFATKSECLGTIGGGIMEYELLQRASKFLEAGKAFSRLEKKVHRDVSGKEASGLFCAGEQSILFGVLSEPDIVREFTKTEAQNLCISEDTFRLVPKTEHSKWAELSLNEGVWCYEESFLNPRRIAIIGGGHCGLALSKTMHDLGFYVSVFDIRKTLTTDRNDDADELHIVEQYATVGAKISHPEQTHVVIMTADFFSDVEALKGLKKSHPYIGLMGSKTKIGKIKSKVDTDLFELLRAPIGLDIGSNTPAEIAVSIAAEIISLRLF